MNFKPIDTRNITPDELCEIFYDLAVSSNTAGEQLVEDRETYELLKEKKEKILCSIIDKMEGETETERRRKAILSQEWEAWSEGFSAARFKFRKTECAYEGFNRLWETSRTLISNKKEERRKI